MAYKNKKVTALLPMKAHSARVTSKNFRMIAGKPLFRWILDTLMMSDVIDHVIINTDARNILSENGLNDGDYDGRVTIRDRKAEICGDFVSMNLVLEDDIKAVKSDIYFMTHTTNPLLSSHTINSMVAAFNNGLETGANDSLFGVNQHQTRFYTPQGEAINHDPNELIRTQDLPPYFEENSCGYLFTLDSFSKKNTRIGTKPLLYQTPALESVDIDEAADWFMAESLLLRVAEGTALPES